MAKSLFRLIALQSLTITNLRMKDNDDDEVKEK